MRRLKLVGLEGAVVFALSALSASPSLAAGLENPEWYVSGHGTLKATTETLSISSIEANGSQTLKVDTKTIVCTQLKLLGSGTLVGGLPGTDEEQLLFSGCASGTCKVKSQKAINWGEIETEPLVSTLAFKTKAAAAGKEAKKNQSVTVLKGSPAFAVVKFEPTSCGFVSELAEVRGSDVLENIQSEEGAAATGAKQELVAANAREYWVNSAGTPTKTLGGLSAVGLEASHKGNAILTAPEAFSVEG